MTDSTGRSEAENFSEAVRVLTNALLGTVKNPDHPSVGEVRSWPEKFDDPCVARAGMLEILLSDYAEFLLSAFGAEQSVEFLVGKLAKLEAITLERDVFDHDAAARGWLNG